MKTDKIKNIWLVSYPKSGNTWLRILLENILEKNNKIDINNLNHSIHSANIDFIEEITGLNCMDLSLKEIEDLRFQALKYFTQNKNRPRQTYLFKVHDMCYSDIHKNLLPINKNDFIMYIVRNPKDIVFSLSEHLNLSIEKTIDFINSKSVFNHNASMPYFQSRQVIGSWSDNVESWYHQSFAPIYFIKYESLLRNTFESFSKALNFVEIKTKTVDIENAIFKSSFKRLRSLEKKSGFAEKSVHSNFFFRKGNIDEWKNKLSVKQIEKLEESNYKMLKMFDYI